MYLYLGSDVIVKKKDIVGIFELDGKITTETTGQFLKYSQKNNIIKSAGSALPKSFVIVKNRDGEKVYFSHISVSSLVKKLDGGHFV